MHASVSPQYTQIAQDIALRIVHGELEEGTILYGRSVMASRYNVSPETVRRALHLLEEMKVVDIKPQGGVRVVSVDSARRYLDGLEKREGSADLREQLKTLLAQSAALQAQIMDLVSKMLAGSETYAAAYEPMPNYEVPIPPHSPVVGRNIGSLGFWQSTGATIVGIRRGRKIITSPGPNAELYDGDVLIIVGSADAVEKTQELVKTKE